ncbi:hypothetical protein BDR04DRAFT_1235224 [Suillus decipiens]|nr:hypothetical protein BDR04DRAFT_1235224 [Suillus decipiens]
MYALSFAARLIALAAIAAAVSAQKLSADCARSVTVQPGDTCDSISAKYHVSTYQLAKVNKKTINPPCTDLVAGEVICLGIKGHDCYVTQVVQPEDTCQKIANEAGIPIKKLLANNPNINTDCTNLYSGEVLCTMK